MDLEIQLFESLEEAHRVIPHLAIKPILIHQKPYALARIGEVFYVFDRYCPHAAYDLSQGNISPLKRIVCPWHNYQFSMDSGQEVSSRCKELTIKKAYPKNGEGLFCKLSV